MSEKTSLMKKKTPWTTKLLSLFCALVLVLSVTPTGMKAFAEPEASSSNEQSTNAAAASDSSKEASAAGTNKEEVVYAKLSQNGGVEGTYVINSFNLDKQTKIEDPGVYTKVTNLSTNQELKNVDGKTKIDAPAGEFFYKGELPADTKLPWTVSIDYKLDGKTVDAQDLAGAQGALTITLKITPQKEGESIFADNYLVQASGSFSTDSVENLQAESGSVAVAGSNHQVSFMVIPGGEGNFEISAQVTNFSFDGFTIAAIPLSMALDIEEFENDEMSSSVDELKNAVAKIDDGAGQLNAGAAEIGDGIALLAANNQMLSSGSSQTKDGIVYLSGSVSALAQGSSTYISSIQAQADEAYAKAAAAQAQATTKQGEYGSAMMGAGGQLQSAYTNLAIASQTSDPTELAAALAALSSDLNGIQTSLGGIQAAVGTETSPGLVVYQSQAAAYSASAETSVGIISAYAEIDEGIQLMAGSLPEMASKYALLDDGIQSYVSGVGKLNTNYAAYSQGVKELKQGTAEFKNETIDIDKKLLDGIKDELKNYLDPDYELHSFTEPSNKAVDRVQFIYMSDSIEEPEPEPVEVEETEEETLWSRLFSVFE